MQVTAYIASLRPIRFFAVGVALLCVGVALQVAGFDVARLPFSFGQTTFGVFAKLGGGVILFGLAVMVLRNDAVRDAGSKLPEPAPQSARDTPPVHIDLSKSV